MTSVPPPLNASRVRAILFDAVGTVISPEPRAAEVYFAAGQRFGSRLTRDEIRARFAAVFGRPEDFEPTTEAGERERWRRIVGAVIDDVGPREAELFHTLWEHFARGSSWRMFDDVPTAVSFVQTRGFITGLASNFDARLRAILPEHPPLAGLELFISSEIGFTKPDPRFFAAVEARLPVRGAEILLVGDDVRNDLEGATDAGWQALLLDRSGTRAPAGVLRSLRKLSGLFV